MAVSGEASTVSQGIAMIRDLHPDLVLLDIQLEDGTGFDILNAFPEVDFKVIFITAYDHYAVQAFRFSAVDYILKPVNPELFAEAVGRAAHMIQAHEQL